MKDLKAHISRREWKTVVVVSILAMLISSIPMLAGMVVAAVDGTHWLGVTAFAPGDMAAYLASIAQAGDGTFLFSNLFTTENLAPTLDIFWLTVGQLARVPGISSLVAFHVFRILLIPLFVSATFVCISCFLSSPRKRIVALLLFTFSSGIGVYFSGLFTQRGFGGVYEYPIDLWVAESNPLMTMIHSPHFVASFTLLIAVAALLYRALERSSYRTGVLAGIAALALFQFHPFHAPTLFAVAGVFVIIRKWRDPASWRILLIFMTLSSPAVIYHFMRLHADSVSESMLAANLTITPHPLHLLLGFGMLWVLAVIGIVTSRKTMQKDAWLFLVTWLVVQLVLVYSPLTFQRRLLEGLFFPLAVFGATGVVVIYERMKGMRWISEAVRNGSGVALAVILLLPSSAFAVMRNIDLFVVNDPQIFFVTDDESEAMRWIDDNLGAVDVIAATFGSGNRIAGWSGRRVYAGHWVNTIDAESKDVELNWLFSSHDVEAQRAFMRAKGITHVYIGERERVLGGDFTWMTPVHVSATVSVYALE
ncbi:hypothetical protein ACFLZO_00410 [Patescibacteria group bacterium]